MRRTRWALVLSLVGMVSVPWSEGRAQPKKQGQKLVFSITEARAYASRASLRKEVIEVAGLRDRLQPCDPQRDPYQCDRTQYAHEPNCPEGVAFGPKGEVAEAAVGEGTPAKSGKAGDGAGPKESPPLASPVTLNDLLVIGSLHHASTSDARGLASHSYVDLSGRQVPEAHTESDAFAANVSRYEERCWPMEGQNVSPNHVHVLSRSERTPSTYHYALCVERGCRFGGPFQGGAERGETIVDLAKDGGQVVGRIRALLEDVTYAGGQLVAESVETVVGFRSDGTANGLEWSVTSKASGVQLAGRPVALPPGEILAVGNLQVGMAAPHVSSTEDGSELRIVAPGLVVAHPEQTAFIGGAELAASFGRPASVDSAGSGATEDESEGAAEGTARGNDVGAASEDGPVAEATESGDPGAGGTTEGSPPIDAGVPGGAESTPQQPGSTAPAGETAAAASSRLSQRGTAATVAILAFGFAALLLLLVRWAGRWEWARGLYAVQPLRALDWLHRAFVKG